MATAAISPNTKIVFSDVNPGVNEHSPLELVYNEDSINRSIVTILNTRKGTRVFRRNFGSYMHDILFDPMDGISVDRVKRELLTAIAEWEPRVVMKSATVIPDYPNQQYFVQLDYYIPLLYNKSASFTFNLSSG